MRAGKSDGRACLSRLALTLARARIGLVLAPLLPMTCSVAFRVSGMGARRAGAGPEWPARAATGRGLGRGITSRRQGDPGRGPGAAALATGGLGCWRPAWERRGAGLQVSRAQAGIPEIPTWAWAPKAGARASQFEREPDFDPH